MRHRKVELKDIVALLWRDRWVIIAVMLVAGALSAWYAVTRKPLFQSEAVLVAARDQQGQMAALSGLVGQFSALTGELGLLSGGGNLDESVAVLESHDFAAKFIHSHGLLPELFPERWNSVRHTWGTDGPGGSSTMFTRAWQHVTGLLSGEGDSTHGGSGVGAREPSEEEAFERFDKIRSAVIDRRTNFVRLKVLARTPELARDWGLKLIQDMNSEMRARALAETNRTISLLSEKIEGVKYESVRTAAVNILEAQLNREILAQSQPDYALRTIDSPSLPETRFYPRRTRMVLMGLLLGFVLAALVSIGRRAWGARSAAVS